MEEYSCPSSWMTTFTCKHPHPESRITQSSVLLEINPLTLLSSLTASREPRRIQTFPNVILDVIVETSSDQPAPLICPTSTEVASSAMEVDVECGPTSETTAAQDVKGEQGEAALEEPSRPLDKGRPNWQDTQADPSPTKTVVDNHNDMSDVTMPGPEDRTPDVASRVEATNKRDAEVPAPQNRTPGIASRTEAANKGDADAQFGHGRFRERHES